MEIEVWRDGCIGSEAGKGVGNGERAAQSPVSDMALEQAAMKDLIAKKL